MTSARQQDRVVIGVDESGTGAGAGPFTVCALAAYEKDADLLRKVGGRDSKRVTDIRRRASINAISDVALFAVTAVVRVEQINKDMRESWRSAIQLSVGGVIELLRSRDIGGHLIKIIIDGSVDRIVKARLESEGVREIEFLTKAEDKVPAVGGASIFAKTERNEAMKLLHEEFPQYGWNKNFGYLTQEHVAAIHKYGRSPHHRDWKIPGPEGESR